jgi:translation initiation factor 1
MSHPERVLISLNFILLKYFNEIKYEYRIIRYKFASKCTFFGRILYIMTRKRREGIVYSTNPDFIYEPDPAEQTATLPPEQQLLYVWLDTKARNGKVVTLVKGFIGSKNDLETLTKELKILCSTGGSVKGSEMIIQGNFREKITAYLSGKGFKVKKAGG